MDKAFGTLNKKSRKTSVSDCCYTTYRTESNGFWSYYVCDKCKDKTEPIKVWNKLVITIK